MKIGYIRVSTEEQNTARQEVLLRELGVDEVFVDKASGKSTDRSELRRMMEYVRKGDTVIAQPQGKYTGRKPLSIPNNFDVNVAACTGTDLSHVGNGILHESYYL